MIGNGKPLEQIDVADLQALVKGGTAERRTLEYKSALPGNGDEARREFLADVSSFANAAGGDLVYGIEDERDEDGRPTGIPRSITALTGLNRDAEKLRIESIIRDGLEPRVPGVHLYFVEIADNSSVLIIRVPRSWRAPHRVTFKNLSRFYSRSSTGKYELDVTELRAAFVASEGISETIRRFRDERIGRLVAQETPVPMDSETLAVLHIIPLSGMAGTTQIDIGSLPTSQLSLSPLGSMGWDHRYNCDGFVTYTSGYSQGTASSYVQLFRNACIEAATTSLVYQDKNERFLPASESISEILTGCQEFLKAEETLGVGMPFILFLSFVGVRGCLLGTPQERFFRPTEHSLDRDILLLPDVLIDSDHPQLDVVLRPVFDALWQSMGWPRCMDYGEDGRWRGIRP